MWPFRSAPQAKPKRLVDLENDVEDHDAAIQHLRQALRELNARVSSVQRWAKPSQDAPSEEIDPRAGAGDSDFGMPPLMRNQGAPTAHLSRRFRGF